MIGARQGQSYVNPPRDAAKRLRPNEYARDPPVAQSPPIPRHSRPPTPSKLRLPEIGRPALREEHGKNDRTEYDKMRRSPSSIQNLQIGLLNLALSPMAQPRAAPPPCEKTTSVSGRHIGTPLAVLLLLGPRSTMRTSAAFPHPTTIRPGLQRTEPHRPFRGVQQGLFHPPQARTTPQFPYQSMPPPYHRPTTFLPKPARTMTYDEVEDATNARLNHPTQ